MDLTIQQLTQLAKEAALVAGSEIIKIYNSAEMAVEYKKDDSPLTKADRIAHEIIVSYLEKTKLPILSEEGKDIPYAKRKDWEYFWMVDPLDGTKEFIKKNGEFTINIALIHRDSPKMGVIYAPIMNWLYWGSLEEGAWKQVGDEPAVQLEKLHNREVNTIVASRSHLNQETQEIIDRYPGAETISMGSSLKFMLVAENKAQLYPRFAPTMEWDTAAAQGILEVVGADVCQMPRGSKLVYNKATLLNPSFLVVTCRN